ncbi:MAG: GNAT family N-acetyltransferase [Oceanospirillaceae bacterium]|nr:GNAT family N-acetyltransferase [Oceanospirillaceae bacterium]MBL33859.1 GNAT family N-acetyltransferase [Oceanospirillaceae bacterium]MBS54701.1 GNAT family N-acetyltransferase [Oceanospirillaceae bacterium]|tara:strand:+ start:4189 stop:4650 length:462 start_codon:yes stop_codon:yes gene_type:complete
MQIVNMKDRPDACRLLAQWHYEEWKELYPTDTEETFYRDLQKSLGADDIPSTWLMVDGETILGSCSIIEDDMESRQDLTPWLANVFVHPDYRGQGLGSKLVNAVMQKARDIGLQRFYLFTEDQTALYQKLGWTVHEEMLNNGIPVTIMRVDFA